MQKDINKLIREFKVAMQKGKQFTISTLSDAAEFTCYMAESSSTLKIKTTSGNVRQTSFKNIERYFNNNPIKDERNYVIAICEWLENTDLSEAVNFNYKAIKETLKLFIKNHKQYLEDGKNGYYYNIFMEANIAGQEIRHSKYLSNLFNKNSNHFHDNLFFKNFIEELKLYEGLNDCNAIVNFNIDSYSVETEKFDNENTEQKGFMDIVIRDDKYMIIIENKTGTKDHSGQLVRYSSYAENKKNNGEIEDYIVLYLTPMGEEPTDINAKNNDKVISISYIQDIRNCMISSNDLIKNKILSDIIQQYIDSIPLYVFNLPINWKYELDTINVITKDLNTFRTCEDITNIVSNNMIEENNIFTNKEISIAKLITKYFIKSKALIERNFMLELSDSIDDSLETYGFVFSKNSNILVEDFPDDNQIDEIYDLNTIYKARQIRQRGFAPKESEEYYQELRDNTKSYLIYEKILDENESLLLLIQNDISGLHISIHNVSNSIYTLLNDYQYILNQDENVFNSTNINKFLNQKFLRKTVQKCTKEITTAIMCITQC